MAQTVRRTLAQECTNATPEESGPWPGCVGGGQWSSIGLLALGANSRKWPWKRKQMPSTSRQLFSLHSGPRVALDQTKAIRQWPGALIERTVKIETIGLLKRMFPVKMFINTLAPISLLLSYLMCEYRACASSSSEIATKS